jgi:hypothetical protein
MAIGMLMWGVMLAQAMLLEPDNERSNYVPWSKRNWRSGISLTSIGRLIEKGVDILQQKVGWLRRNRRSAQKNVKAGT